MATLFERNLAEVRRLAVGLGPQPRRHKSKGPRTGKHRVIGQRRCFCGEVFDLRSDRPGQQSCGRYCVGRSSALCAAARKAESEKRLERWAVLVRKYTAAGKLTVGAMVDMCAEAYRVGYMAGVQQRKRLLR